MHLSNNTLIPGTNCRYRILEEILPSCYQASVTLSGDLGDFDSNSHVLLVIADMVVSSIKRYNTDSIIERIVISQNEAVIIPDTQQNRQTILSYLPQSAPDRPEYGVNRYKGQIQNGQPHGYGTLYYSDGRVYTGYFVNGMRHGRGKLTMPNGESFEGEFFKNSITENGTYYDEDGRPRDVSQNHPPKSFIKNLWDKSWRLPAAAACITLAIVSTALLYDFFTSERGGVIKVGALFAPLLLGWLGLQFFVEFIIELSSKTKED